MHSFCIFVSAFLLIRTTAGYVGDITYFNPGLGSCGIQSSDADAIVALSIPMMNNPANPNLNPKCGSTVSIFNPTTGRSHRATVVDTCQGCAPHDLDLSPSLFRKVAPNGDGRVHGISWGGRTMGS